MGADQDSDKRALLKQRREIRQAGKNPNDPVALQMEPAEVQAIHHKLPVTVQAAIECWPPIEIHRSELAETVANPYYSVTLSSFQSLDRADLRTRLTADGLGKLGFSEDAGQTVILLSPKGRAFLQAMGCPEVEQIHAKSRYGVM